MNRKKVRGISLIVLVITIIVIIVLAGAVILGLANNNPISKASKATFLSDLRNFETELDLYESQQFLDKMGGYDITKLQADETSVTYDGNVDTSKTMYDLMPTLGKATKYAGQFVVVDGRLVFQGSDINRQSWSTEAGIEVIVAGEPRVTILSPSDTVVAPGTDIVYTVKFSSNAALTTIDLNGKVEVLDNNNVALAPQPVITIGTVSGTNLDAARQVDITIKTDSLTNGTYKLKIKAGSVTNADNVSNSQDKISLVGFDIDDTAPENPTMSANPTGWTNGNVTVSVVYSADSTIKEYSLDGTNWSNYTVPVVVTANNTTVYARGKDSVKNESGLATLTVTNIDKVAPIVVYGTNGGTDLSQASTTITVSDTSGSGVNISTLQYLWDTQNVNEPTSGWTAFTNGGTVNKTEDGTYYLWVKAADNAGNNVVSKSQVYVVGEVITIVSTVQSVNKTFSGATTGFTYSDPVIPAGFVAVNTSAASWNNLSTDWNKGLVVQDSSENQFVWVPVNGSPINYAEVFSGGDTGTNSTYDDTVPAGFNVNNITTTYKGFYIARYEAMFDYNGGNIRAASKKSKNKTTTNWSTARNSTYDGYLWNWIEYADAKTYAQNMASSYGYDLTKVGTNLITAVEWDTLMKWIQNSGKNIIDSRSWGNYFNSISPADVAGYSNLQISGYSNQWKANNIYDLAGNLMEWTGEFTNSYSQPITRGGFYSYSGSIINAVFRSIRSSGHTWITFRTALYVL